MSPSIADVGLSARAVFWLGIALIVAGLVLPFAVLLIRMARWEPPEQRVSTAGGQLRPEMVMLSPGTFEMGSPEDEEGRDNDEMLHTVTLTRGFMLSRTEVTQGQYAAVVGERPVDESEDANLKRPCRVAGLGEDRPVVCIDWLEAVRYCNALSEAEGLDLAYDITGDRVTWRRENDGYRLPTEAEWEYAARALSRDAWVGTDIESEVCRFANVLDRSAEERFGEEHPVASLFSCDDGSAVLTPVGSLLENRWCLHGLGGNAAEWVWDGYGDHLARPAEDPTVNKAGPYRMIRGGSWGDGPRDARVANRVGIELPFRYGLLGFRLARSLPSAD